MVNKIPSELDNPINNIMYKQIDTTLPTYNKMNFSPNTITTISLLFGLSAVYAVYKDYYKLGGVIFFLAYYFDCADGKFARKYNKATIFGDYYDHISDLTKFILMFYVLYFKLKSKSFKTKTILLSILIILLICSILQFGCQEYLHAKNESPTLSWTTKFINTSNCENQVKITKYLSVTTFITYVCVVIFFWEYL
jgi:phosphatidylglycerophosphate synthase